jgi:hypothetical protein
MLSTTLLTDKTYDPEAALNLIYRACVSHARVALSFPFDEPKIFIPGDLKKIITLIEKCDTNKLDDTLKEIGQTACTQEGSTWLPDSWYDPYEIEMLYKLLLDLRMGISYLPNAYNELKNVTTRPIFLN